MRASKTGQSTIELALVLTIFIGMLSVTYNAVVAFSIHQYFSYAAFMAARALQASGVSKNVQRDSAVQALRRYIPSIDSSSMQADVFTTKADGTGMVLARNIQARVYEPSASSESGYSSADVGHGIAISFQVPFVRLPIGAGFREGLEFFDMNVVSYLGREPSVIECRMYFEDFYRSVGGSNGAHSYKGMEDSGC